MTPDEEVAERQRLIANEDALALRLAELDAAPLPYEPSFIRGDGTQGLAPPLAPLAAHQQPVPVVLDVEHLEPAQRATSATWATLAVYVVAMTAYVTLSLAGLVAAGVLPGVVAVVCAVALLRR